MENVIITIVSNIRSEDSDDNGIIEFTTVGKMAKKEDKICIFYDESKDLAENTKTVMHICDNNVVKIIRSGDNNSKIVVEKGKRHTNQYQTAVGTMSIGVSGSEVGIEISDSVISVHLDYNIDVNAKFLSRNCIDVTIRKDESCV